MLCRNQTSSLVSLDTTTTPSESTNRNPSLPERRNERMKGQATKAVYHQHDERNHADAAACASKDPSKSTTENETSNSVANGEKRSRTWNLDPTEDVEATKKMKIETDHRLGVKITSQNPTRSLHTHPGDEKRCTVDETHTSSSSSRSRDQQENHYEVDHNLLTGSFDTISVCPSAMDTVQEQNIGVTDDALLSPRQKTHTPTDEDVLSPQGKATRASEANYTPNVPNGRQKTLKDSFNKDVNHFQRYHEDSPHSPPQRIVHVDGDDNACGDISPIKFSPPATESPPPESKSRDLESSHQYCRDDPPKAAEVSFDTSTGYQSYRSQEGHEQKSMTKTESRKQREENERSYSASTRSDAKTPPRRGTSRAHAVTGSGSVKHFYKPVYSMAPPIPRDISHPHGITSHYPHHPQAFSDTNHTPGDARMQRDQANRYYRSGNTSLVQNGHSSREDFSSPIRPSRPSRPSYRTANANPTHREATPSKYDPTYFGSPWVGHGYSAEQRGYPPPRVRLPPHSNNYYWNPDQTLYQERYRCHSTAIPTQEIQAHGHPKGSAAPDAPNQYHLQHPNTRGSNPYRSTSHVPGAGSKDQFALIRSIRKIFQGFSYLLYPVHMGVQWGDNQQIIHTNSEDLKVARRRIESAICALGGYIKDYREDLPDTPTSSSRFSHAAMPSSVFRQRYKRYSSIYEDQFHNRYFVGDHGVSWDVEENPPVAVSIDDEDSTQIRNGPSSGSSGTNRSGMPKSPRLTNLAKQESTRHEQPMQNDSFLVCQPISSHVSRMQMNQLQQQKMKYRCKLCGQPKQNHVCPYQKSLVRTLGIMVCPAVNAYNSAEPGVLTPPLSEMNNFVPYGSNDEGRDIDSEISPREQKASSSYTVTPGGSQKQHDRFGRHHSPATSSLSTSPHSDYHDSQSPSQQRLGVQIPPKNFWQPQKSSIMEYRQKPLFMTLALRPEHYRAVTPRTPYRNGSSSGKMAEGRDDKEENSSYKYPHVPLTFLGRKRLTDTLFYLSQSIPSVTADVASLLRMARERDEWDLAVSEVLTQVVVCIHCSEGDHRLDGLKNYLLRIGIAS